MPVAQTSPEIAAPKPLWSWKLAPAFIVVTSAIPLFGFENRLVGYPWLVIGLVVAYFVDRELTRDLGIRGHDHHLRDGRARLRCGYRVEPDRARQPCPVHIRHLEATLARAAADRDDEVPAAHGSRRSRSRGRMSRL